MIHTSIVLLCGCHFLHSAQTVQDGGAMPSTQTPSKSLGMSCSACGGKGEPALNCAACGYFLDTTASFDFSLPISDDVMMSNTSRYTFHARPMFLKLIRSYEMGTFCSSICNVRTVCHIIWTVSGISSQDDFILRPN